MLVAIALLSLFPGTVQFPPGEYTLDQVAQELRRSGSPVSFKSNIAHRCIFLSSRSMSADQFQSALVDALGLTRVRTDRGVTEFSLTREPGFDSAAARLQLASTFDELKRRTAPMLSRGLNRLNAELKVVEYELLAARERKVPFSDPSLQELRTRRTTLREFATPSRFAFLQILSRWTGDDFARPAYGRPDPTQAIILKRSDPAVQTLLSEAKPRIESAPVSSTIDTTLVILRPRNTDQGFGWEALALSPTGSTFLESIMLERPAVEKFWRPLRPSLEANGLSEQLLGVLVDKQPPTARKRLTNPSFELLPHVARKLERDFVAWCPRDPWGWRGISFPSTLRTLLQRSECRMYSVKGSSFLTAELLVEPASPRINWDLVMPTLDRIDRQDLSIEDLSAYLRRVDITNGRHLAEVQHERPSMAVEYFPVTTGVLLLKAIDSDRALTFIERGNPASGTITSQLSGEPVRTCVREFLMSARLWDSSPQAWFFEEARPESWILHWKVAKGEGHSNLTFWLETVDGGEVFRSTLRIKV